MKYLSTVLVMFLIASATCTSDGNAKGYENKGSNENWHGLRGSNEHGHGPIQGTCGQESGALRALRNELREDLRALHRLCDKLEDSEQGFEKQRALSKNAHERGEEYKKRVKQLKCQLKKLTRKYEKFEEKKEKQERKHKEAEQKKHCLKKEIKENKKAMRHLRKEIKKIAKRIEKLKGGCSCCKGDDDSSDDGSKK